MFGDYISCHSCVNAIDNLMSKREGVNSSVSVKMDRHSQDGEATIEGPVAPVFVLIIGINEYEHNGNIIKNLSGCVADAEDMVAFLTANPPAGLGVPIDNVKKLINNEATAAAIIAALESFTEAYIPKGAIIFIFYAGHGTQAPPPKRWNWTREKIQMLMPHDFYPGLQPDSNATAPSDTTTVNGNKRFGVAAPTALDPKSRDITPNTTVIRNGLSDVRFGQLLEDIAKAKGNNITVVLDCCHSGSATRGEDQQSRGVVLHETSQLDDDALPTGHRGQNILDKDKNKGLDSHVLLTACSETQHAFEKNGKGVVTSALMNLLRTEDFRRLTYSDIVKKLPEINSQQPQCEGINKDRIFLHNHTPASRPILHNLTWQLESGATVPSRYKIDAGNAHGVTDDAEFIVYQNDACTSELGHLVVDKTEPFHSVLRYVDGGKSFDIPPTGAVALQIGFTQDVRLLLKSDDHELAIVLSKLEKAEMVVTSAFRSSFKLVAAEDENPDLVVTTVAGGTARFEIQDEHCRSEGLFEIYHRPDTKEKTLANVLRGVARFYRNLRYTNLKRRIAPLIVFRCYELEEVDIDEGLRPVLKPTGNNLCELDSIKLVVNPSVEKSYGFSIENKSKVPLFVSVFYFNMSDLSVEACYQPPAASHQGQVPSIMPKSLLTIGYGSDGHLPQGFDLLEGQNVDVGYIKLFLATEHVDYSNVLQRSPFEVDDGRGIKKTFPNSKLWDTKCIRVVLRKEGWTRDMAKT